MTSVKWIKLSVSMFDDEKIKVIEAMPEGDSLLLIWVKLLTLAGKTNLDGYIYISENIPYTESVLSAVMNKPITIIHLALETFKSFGMIEEDENGFYLVNYDKYQSVSRLQEIREYNRLAQQRHREKIKKKMLSMTNVNDNSMTSQKCQATDIDIDKDIDINNINIINNIYSENEQNNSKNNKKTKHKFGEYKNVLLTDDEYKKLSDKYPDIEDIIKFFDEYIERKGYSAKSHYLCFSKWVVDAYKEELKKKKKKEEDEYWNG